MCDHATAVLKMEKLRELRNCLQVEMHDAIKHYFITHEGMNNVGRKSLGFWEYSVSTLLSIT